MMFSTSRPAAEPVSTDSATDTNATPRRSKRSNSSHRFFTVRVSRSSHDDGLCLAVLHHREQSGHARPVQALGGLTALDDDFAQFGALHQRHSPNLLRLSFERNPIRNWNRASGQIARCWCLSRSHICPIQYSGQDCAQKQSWKRDMT
jgi:hypothetical protein